MKKPVNTMVFAVCLLLLLPVLACAQLTDKETLGKLLYFDTYLSLNHNQACASCHWPTAGYADPINAENPELWPVSEGSILGKFGGRNAPSAAYAAASPKFAYIDNVGYVGGQFWDGRANGLQAQAKGPFLNPVEMAMADSAAVLAAIADTANANYEDYKVLFQSVYHVNIDNFTHLTVQKVGTIYDHVADAIATYERSGEVILFNSAYDVVLSNAAVLTGDAAAGKILFDAKCSQCHPTDGLVTVHQITMPTVLSNFTYHNLGLPHNARIDELTGVINPPDLGLGGRADINAPEEYGKFKTPTLRNIAKTAPYGHNGYFATLADMVHFLNNRGDFSTAEVSDNMTSAVGDLGLSSEQEGFIVAFLLTLTDQVAE